MIDPQRAADLIATALRDDHPRVVLLAGGLTALDAPGGGETQMLATARALAQVGVAARMWRPWEDDLSRAHVLHLFGSLPEHLPLIASARRRGMKVVLSPIAWFDPLAVWHEPRPLLRRAAACGVLAARGAFPRWPSWRRRLYESVDLLMPNSQAEARQLVQYFDVPLSRIHVVPNGADLRFAEGDRRAFAERFGVQDFILYCGRIEPRKNQLQFLQALDGVQVPIVILGDPLPAHRDYYQACRLAAGPRVHFLERLDHDDPLLADAYAACRCLVLTSWYETPGLAALEAAMTGTPLVLTDRGATREYFGDLARYARPQSRAEIRQAVLTAVERPRSLRLAEHVCENFSWLAAAQVTQAGYQRVLEEDHATK
jgi:glycosyltransferase involved in cell wall biosynthesis